MSGSGRAGAALVLGIAGGLGLAGSALATWVRQAQVDEVAGVPIEQVDVTLGVEVAPLVLPIGVAAAALALGLALRRPLVRRALGAVLLALGVGACVAVAAGIVAGSALDGALATGAYAAAAAALAVTAAGVLAVRPAPPAPPALPPRYDLDAEDDDSEWRLASVEDEDPGR